MSPNDMVIFFLSIAIMLSIGLLLGEFARRLHFPAIIGELIGGIILGPTILGWLDPGIQDWLFPVAGPVFMGRDALIQIALVFFLFSAGLEMNLGIIKKHRSSILWTSFLGIVIPFVLGFGLVVLFPRLWGENVQGSTTLFALFMGTALSISALPVIARILMDMNLMNTDMGMIIMGSATINDLIGWSLFALILSDFSSGSVLNLPPYVTFILALALFAFILTIGRTVAQKVQQRFQSDHSWPGVFFGIAMVYVMLAAAIAEVIGIHAVFGAFIVGMALSSGDSKRGNAINIVYQFVMYFFAPLYFVSIGLQVDFLTSFDPVLVAVVLIVACAGKIIGATLGAKIGKLSTRRAVAVGFAMNTRGAMEIILAGVAKSAGLIDDRIFVALVIMAIVTSLISGPVIGRLHKSMPATATDSGQI